MTKTKNSAPAESTWDSYFLNTESVSDDFMSKDDRLDDLELKEIVQERLDANETPVRVSFDDLVSEAETEISREH